MKVRVSFTVEVDALAWAEAYGTGTSLKVIRDDVKVYAEQIVRMQIMENNLGPEEAMA